MIGFSLFFVILQYIFNITMKYFEVEFTLTPCTQVAQDLLSALAGEVGFETFEETQNGLTGYVQQSLFNESSLQQMLACFPLDDTQIKYDVREAEDRDWNEQWEQEGFEPIEVRGERLEARAKTLVIHDGRHLPSAPSDIMIEIDAHLAFGTGTHETTQMICQTLLERDLKGMEVLDCGCGTGILGICTLKLGAEKCLAYDIDEWSVDNTRHNAVINQVDDKLTPLHGDASLLDAIEERFHVVLANINRNILLQDMERFVSVMAPQATLVLSGFYEEDCALLKEKAHSLGLTLQESKKNKEWACLIFQTQ
jgi:ribosomal protein L11 methyltransferase